MTAIFAITPLLTFLEQVVKDVLYSFPMCRIRFVEREHVDEDDMSLMHEEVTEQIEIICLADLLCCLDPIQNLFALGGYDGTVVVVCADAAAFLG